MSREDRNHFVPHDAPVSRGLARAICGELVVVREQHTAAPNCVACVRRLAEDEAAIAALQEESNVALR